MSAALEISLAAARRLALRKQLLDSRSRALSPADDKAAIARVFQALRCIQIDPIRAVERTELLVLWSRIGAFDPRALRELAFVDKRLFEDWAHCASIVLMEDYPLFLYGKRAYAHGDGSYAQRMRRWLRQNDALVEHVKTQLAARGPLATGEFDASIAHVPWMSSGWSSGRSVPRILDHLFGRGEVMVADRAGTRKAWHLTSAFLPDWADTRTLDARDVSRAGLQHALKALGAATGPQIRNHFLRKAYPQWRPTLRDLHQEGKILSVRIRGDDGEPVPGEWYLHADDQALLPAMEAAAEPERTVLLSPFDNLICDRARTRQLFHFDYAMEIYVPVAQRKYGYYVLPVLAGDRFLGRLDAHMDRKAGILRVKALYPEPQAATAGQAAEGLAQTLRELGAFLGATRLKLGRRMSVRWRQALKGWL